MMTQQVHLPAAQPETPGLTAGRARILSRGVAGCTQIAFGSPRETRVCIAAPGSLLSASPGNSAVTTEATREFPWVSKAKAVGQ